MLTPQWVLYVTIGEFSEIARLAEKCRIRTVSIEDRGDGFDDVQWVTGLSRLGLDPPEPIRLVTVLVVEKPPAIRYVPKRDVAYSNGKLTLEL